MPTSVRVFQECCPRVSTISAFTVRVFPEWCPHVTGICTELLVIVYNNHPLWKKKVDDEARLILATQDSIYRMLVEKLQFETSKALKIRNEWLAKRLVGDDRK